MHIIDMIYLNYMTLNSWKAGVYCDLIILLLPTTDHNKLNILVALSVGQWKVLSECCCHYSNGINVGATVYPLILYYKNENILQQSLRNYFSSLFTPLFLRYMFYLTSAICTEYMPNIFYFPARFILEGDKIKMTRTAGDTWTHSATESKMHFSAYSRERKPSERNAAQIKSEIWRI